MKFFATALVSLPLLISAPAQAASVTVTFDSVSSFASIGSHYAGGTDSNGVTGTNLFLNFGPDALALANDALGPYYSNAPTPAAVMVPVGSAATMNASMGVSFTGALAFFYSSSLAVADAVQVWSGVDGSGSLLASFSLLNNAKSGGCSDSDYCNFNAVTLPFAGNARSVTFGGAANVAAFDNINVNTVSEPTTAALAALALLGVAAMRKRS